MPKTNKMKPGIVSKTVKAIEKTVRGAVRSVDKSKRK